MTDQQDQAAPTLRIQSSDLRHSASAKASPIRVGRGGDADVHVGDEAVSAEHLQLVAERGTWAAVDRSGGDTFTSDGERVERVPVAEDGVRLRLGGADGPEIRLAVDSAPVAPPQRGPKRPETPRGPASGLRARFLALTGPWSRRRIVTLIAVSVLAAGVAYILNVWLVGVHYDGTVNVPSDAAVASSFSDNEEWTADWQGMLFWFLVAALAAAIVTQLVIFGPTALFKKAIALPARLRNFPSRVGPQWSVALSLGIAVGLVLGGLVIPASRAVVGLGILLFLPFALGGIVVGLVSRASLAVLPSLTRQAEDPSALAGTWLIGTSLGLMLAFLISSGGVRLGFAVVLVAFAVLKLQGRIPTGSVFLVVPAAIAIDWLVAAPQVLAHDGGFTECVGYDPATGSFVGTVEDFAEFASSDCAGVEDARNAGGNAVPPAAAGAGVGSAAGGRPRGPGFFDGPQFDPPQLGEGPRLDEPPQLDPPQLGEGPQLDQPPPEPPGPPPAELPEQHWDQESGAWGEQHEDGSWTVTSPHPDGGYQVNEFAPPSEHGRDYVTSSTEFDSDDNWVSTSHPDNGSGDNWNELRRDFPETEDGIDSDHWTRREDGSFTRKGFDRDAPEGEQLRFRETRDGEGNVQSRTDYTHPGESGGKGASSGRSPSGPREPRSSTPDWPDPRDSGESGGGSGRDTPDW